MILILICFFLFPTFAANTYVRIIPSLLKVAQLDTIKNPDARDEAERAKRSLAVYLEAEALGQLGLYIGGESPITAVGKIPFDSLPKLIRRFPDEIAELLERQMLRLDQRQTAEQRRDAEEVLKGIAEIFKWNTGFRDHYVKALRRSADPQAAIDRLDDLLETFGVHECESKTESRPAS